MAGIWDSPPTADELKWSPPTPEELARSRPPLLQMADRLDAQSSPRALLPGLWALTRGTPENTAERAVNEKLLRGGRQPLGEVADLYDRTSAAPLMLAPTAGPPKRLVKPPRVATNPAAQVLESSGVTGLTAGQRADPNSVVAIVERASADNPLGMKAQREAAKESFMRAAQNKGLAPGAQPPANPDLQTRLGEIFDAYGPVYGQLKGNQVAPAVLDNLRSASSMPNRGVDARTAAAARAEIENALTVLGPKPQAPPPSGLLGPNGQPIPPPAPPPMKATVGDLMKARENVREAKRAAIRSEDFDRIRLLSAAEDEFSAAIRSALPADQQALLKQADTQYARLMSAATAAPAGQTTFTPGQYLRRVEKSAGARNFKKGEAGDLQDLGEAARIVFQDAPMTGVRPGILSAIPGAKALGAPLSRLANSDAGRRFLFQPRPYFVPSDPMARFTAPAAWQGGALSPDPEALLRAMRVRPRGASAGEEEKWRTRTTRPAR